MTTLIITADDYGYDAAYDVGILEAARAGAVDAVSSFSTRAGVRPGPLLTTGVDIGLHLDLAEPLGAARAGEAGRERARAEIDSQLRRFHDLFVRPPAYLDGHHHCHARDGIGAVAADVAAGLGIPMRSVAERHRRLLRCRGVKTPDLLIGRLDEREPVLPAALGEGSKEELPPVVEWMVHPGRRSPQGGSSYDAGREEDLALLLSWRPPEGIRRAGYSAALDDAK